MSARLSVERPFTGLRPFTYEDRAFFFGRTEQAYALYRLTTFGFIAVIGSSGSGKSSLVRAGLLPLLLENEAAKRWSVATLTPGEAPIARLADAVASLAAGDLDAADRTILRDRAEYVLRRSSSGLADAIGELPGLAEQPVMIVVDQFEEIFRYADSSAGRNAVGEARWRDESAAFVQLLLQAFRRRPSMRVLITMRSDFIGDCAEFPGLPEAVSDTQFLVPALARAQRERAIRGPIDAAGATIDATLVQRLLNDVGYELDQLPVLQHCLARMWVRARERSLPPALADSDYRDVGELAGALSQHADAVMADLPGSEPIIAQVFRALSERDAEGRATRRPISFRSLVDETGMAEPDVRRVVDRFRASDCSFLLPSVDAVPELHDDTRIDVVHEALLRRWERIASSDPALHGWLDDEDDDGRYYRSLLARIDLGETTLPIDRVEERCAWWTSRPRSDAWAARYGGRRERVQKFFDDSRAARDADLAARRAVAVRTGAAITLAVVALIAGFAYAWVTAEHDRGRSLVAQSRLLARDASNATNGGDAVTGTLLALEALPLHVDRPDRPFVWDAQLALAESIESRTELFDLRSHDGPMYGESFTPDGSRLATIDGDGLVYVWNAANGKLVRSFGKTRQAGSCVAYAPDVKQIASCSYDGIARFWDTTTGALRLAIDTRAGPLYALAFSPDGARIVTGSSDGIVRVWDARSGRALMKITGHHGAVYSVAFSLDGARIATASSDKTACLWNAKSGALLATLQGHEKAVSSVEFSRDGRRVVTSSRDGTARVWNARSAKVLQTFLVEGTALNGAAFSPDGTRVVTAGNDRTARIWDVATGATLLVLRGHSQYLFGAHFSPDGAKIATISQDRTARLWDARLTALPRVFTAGDASNNDAEYSPDGKRIVTASGDNVARVRDAASGRVNLTLRGHARGVNVAAFSPDGARIVTGSEDHTARIWDARTGRVERILHADDDEVISASFSPDGKRVLTASFDGASRIWQADTGKLLRTFALNWYVHSAEFSPDGKSVLTGADDGRAWLWDAETGRAIRHFPTEGVGRVYVAAFSTDGRRVATEDDVTFDVDIWDIASGALLATLRGHNEYVYSIAFSPDGTRIVTASGDRTARIWNAASGRPLQVLRGHEATVFSAYFSPDSRHVVTASSDGTTRVWSVRALPWRCQALIDYARTSAPRQLTDLERREEFLEPRDPAPPVNLFGAGDSCS